MRIELSVKTLAEMFKERIVELLEEPEFQWGAERTQHAVDENGEPCVRLAIGNVALDYDLWKGLKNPAVVGLYPAGLKEIWEFQANRKKERVDEFGRQTIFQIPRSFDFARRNYSRAVLISVMLPFSPRVVGDYAQIIRERKRGSSHGFSRMYKDVNLMIDKATSRVAMDLVAGDNVVVAMDDDTVEGVSTEAIPMTHQGTSHGPSKGRHYPQKSVAVLTGLGQFAICRVVIRDELVDGGVQRFVGPIRSIIIFDKNDLVREGSDSILYPTEAWREFLFRLFDFTDIKPDVNKYRFCTYIPYEDEGCRECIRSCHWGALANSVPTPKGKYPERITRQQHRFWEGQLQFDFASCLDERGQMATLFPEWSCGRCPSICATEGRKRAYAAENYRGKMLALTNGSKAIRLPGEVLQG